MATDLSDPRFWFAWSGNALTGDGTGTPPLPCLRNDGAGPWQRHATHRTFAAPVTLSGWFEWIANRDPRYPHAGVVLGFTQDNNHGYHLAIRADGRLQLQLERDADDDGDGDYGRLTTDGRHDARPGDGLRHQFHVTFGAERISGEVDGVRIAEDAGTHAAKGWPRYRTARLGLRLDRQHLRLGSLVATY